MAVKIRAKVIQVEEKLGSTAAGDVVVKNILLRPVKDPTATAVTWRGAPAGEFRLEAIEGGGQFVIGREYEIKFTPVQEV